MSRLRFTSCTTLFMVLASCGGNANQKAPLEEDVPPSSGEGDGDPMTDGDGAGGGNSGTGGGNSGTGGRAQEDDSLFEPDEEEDCESDPRAGEWFHERIEGDFVGSSVASGGDLVALTYLVGDNWTLRVGRITDEIAWGADLERGESGGTVHIAPDGSMAFLESRNGEERELRILQLDALVWSEPLELPPHLSDGFGITMLSAGRALFNRALGPGSGVTKFTPEGGFQTEETNDASMSRVFPVGNEGISIYSNSIYVEAARTRLEYTWDDGFGEVEEIPPEILLEATWSQFFFEDRGGTGARGIRLWLNQQTTGLYLHTRYGGTWDEGTRVTDFDLQVNHHKLISAGPEIVLVNESASSLDMRTRIESGWTDWTALARSRSTTFHDAAGNADGTALVVGEQKISSEGVHSTKLYRRSSEGTWYCPELRSPHGMTTISPSQRGSFLVKGSSYSSPIDLWVLPRERE